MTAPVYQMPFREEEATEVSPRLFRKQVLKVAEIPYKGKRLKFDRDYLDKAVASFGKAFDQVPFVLADADNKHSTAPERFQGEVKSLELNGDGIDALVELTEEGAEIVRKNPRLGVSVRLVPDVERNGETFPVAVEHVCGTLNPRVHGMTPWETVSLSVHWGPYSGNRGQVIDLTATTDMADETFTSDHLTKLNELPEDQRSQVTALLEGKAEPTKPEVTTPVTPEPDGKKSVADFMRGILGKKGEKLEDKDLEDAFTKLQTPETEAAEPVAASLSDDDRKRIDLAEEVSRKADQRVAAAEWKTERTELAQAGVPPSMLDLAEPILKTGQKAVIDLSDDSKADASDVIRKLLTAAKGTVDLSAASGTSDETEEKYTDKDWEASV